jgi:hypothetical protein
MTTIVEAINHGQAPESPPRWRKMALSDSILHNDAVSGVSCGNHLLYCDHLCAFQDCPGI